MDPYRKKQLLAVAEEGGFLKLIQSWLLIALGVIIAAHTNDGIQYDHGSALFLAVIILSFFNLVLKPILLLFTLPFIVLTMGIGIWVINALLFMLTAQLVNGFFVESFGSALWGALIVSLTSITVNALLKQQKQSPIRTRKMPPPRSGSSNDVIDI